MIVVCMLDVVRDVFYLSLKCVVRVFAVIQLLSFQVFLLGVSRVCGKPMAFLKP